MAQDLKPVPSSTKKLCLLRINQNCQEARIIFFRSFIYVLVGMVLDYLNFKFQSYDGFNLNYYSGYTNKCMVYLTLQFYSLNRFSAHFMDHLLADLREEHLGEGQLYRLLSQLIPLVGSLAETILSK